MPNYVRAFAPGGTFFFTTVTERRAPILCSDLARPLLRAAFHECRSRFPFELPAMVLLPDHFHSMWTLPEHDADFSTRWSVLKRRFAQLYLEHGGVQQPVSESRERNRRLGIWQRRFWEHLIRDRRDRLKHLDYIHFNPVKHGYVKCPHAWPYSSFHRYVRMGVYAADWCCACDGREVKLPNFDGLDVDGIEQMGE
jgi:putative transposase